jgi:hypothetical protein
MQAALVVILLLAILAGAVFVGHYGWVSAGDVVMPTWGWMMVGLGVFFTLLVGGGLMAWSSIVPARGSMSRLIWHKRRSVGRPSGRSWYQVAKNPARPSDRERMDNAQAGREQIRLI